MSIKTREEANNYYNQLNKLVDEYTDSHKIRPSNLKRYLKPGSDRFKRFLKRNNLSDVAGIDRVLSDVIDDRVNMETDGVFSFETYKYFESNEFKINSLKECLYKGIEKADIEMEKIIADYFDVNLGSIDVIDSDKHRFKIEDWKNDDWICCVYSSEEFEVIRINIIEHLYSELTNKEIDLVNEITIKLSDLIKKESYETKMRELLSDEKLVKIVAESLGEEWSFEKEFRGYFVWIS